MIKELKRTKMRITRTCMIHKRKRRWNKSMNWLDGKVDRLIDIKNANPEDIQDFEVPIDHCYMAALYPNLDTKQAAMLVFKAIMETDMKWEQIDYLEAVRYIALNWSEVKCRTSKLRRVLPVRRGTRGSRPGMTGAGPSGPGTGDTEQWIFPKVKLTGMEKKCIIATVAEIMTDAMFRTHIYTFGGEMYRQEGGGPIGFRSTCSVARLVMKMWDDKWLERLDNHNIRLEEATRYMDDGRAALNPFKHGWRWSGDTIKSRDGRRKIEISAN